MLAMMSAEANSNVLSGRSVAVSEPEGDGDPLIEAAERALLAREAVGTGAGADEQAARRPQNSTERCIEHLPWGRHRDRPKGEV